MEAIPHRSVWRQVLYLTWPVLAQQALLFTVNIYDRFLAGNNEPADISQHVAYQAAQTQISYLAWGITSYTVLVSVGSTALVARFVGARDYHLANRTLHQSVLLAVLLGLAGGVLGLVFANDAVNLLGLSGSEATITVEFIRPLLAMLVFQVLELAGVACLVGSGDTRTGPIVSGIVAVLNMPLAWSLLHGFWFIPAKGIVGIAYGTALSHLIGCTVVLAVLARGRHGLRLRWREFNLDFGLMYRLLRVSVPAAVDSMSVMAGQLWFLSLVNRLGDPESRAFIIAAHGHAIQWEALGYLSGYAFGIASMALVGQNLGAKQPERAAKSGWTALLWGGGFMCVMGAIFFTFAPQMLHLFSPGQHQHRVIELGVPVLRLVAFATPAMACTIILTASLRGAGDTRVPVLFTWLGFLGVRIPLAYLLTREQVDLGLLGTIRGWDLGLFGAWIAMFADLYVRGGLFLARYAGGKWKATRV
jgi:putative MATE family efflux protein